VAKVLLLHGTESKTGVFKISIIFNPDKEIRTRKKSGQENPDENNF
jgi:hypothetical protein